MLIFPGLQKSAFCRTYGPTEKVEILKTRNNGSHSNVLKCMGSGATLYRCLPHCKTYIAVCRSVSSFVLLFNSVICAMVINI
jgi:hypothetical protein